MGYDTIIFIFYCGWAGKGQSVGSDNMGVDLATYRARIGCFISRRNVSCDDEKGIITTVKETLRVMNVSKAPSTTNLKITTIKVSSSSPVVGFCTYGRIEFNTLLRKSPQVR